MASRARPAYPVRRESRESTARLERKDRLALQAESPGSNKWPGVFEVSGPSGYRFVACPAGKVIVGGGYQVLNNHATMRIDWSRPVFNFGAAGQNGWLVT